MNRSPKISIIIPLYKKTAYFSESIDRCLELDYPNYEILIGVDHGTKIHFSNPKIKILETGLIRSGPAEKRDIGILKSYAEYIAFLDDDSYPRRDWLNQAITIFSHHPEICAIGGPGLTPPTDNFSQHITGAILSTFWGTGPYTYRFTQKPSRYVDDYPAYNLIVRRDTLVKVGGFDNKYYGGEDTALCIKLINAGEKILYHPDVVVFHHRRAFPGGYLKQVANVGKHRGYFVKKHPQTSFRPSYFMPLMGIIITIFILFHPQLLFLGLLLYLAGVLDAKRNYNWGLSTVLPFCIYLSHLSYASNFLIGLVFTTHIDI